MKGIIFDKDGTLLNFEAFWLPITDGVLKDLAHKFCVSAEAEKSVKQSFRSSERKRRKRKCTGNFAARLRRICFGA